MTIRNLALASLIAATAPLVAGCGQTIDANGNGVDPAIHRMVGSAAWRAGVPVNVAHAVVAQESGYRTAMRGRAGEWGIGQIKCQTARSVGFAGPCSQLHDPEVNLTYSMAYLRLALDKGGEGCSGVSLYNTGIYARPRCTGYGRAVVRRAR